VPFALPGQASARSEIRVQRADGSRGFVALSVSETTWQGAPALLAILDDITERKSDEERMRRLAFQDTLTSLPNRSGFLDHLRRLTRRAPDQTNAFALLFIDLDRFKAINDTLGHAVGDDLLAAVASRLSNQVRGADCVARMGGDEFTATISGVRTPQDVEAVVRKFRDAFRDPFAFQDRTLYITASIGVALYPSDGRDPDLLLRHADTAMYDAKSRGAGLFSLYRPEMSVETQSRLELEAALHRAVSRGEFVLHYQPQVRLADRAAIGAEALLRWRHPERGLLAPDQFLPLLEDTGLIIEVGEWVLESACAQALSWRREGEHAPPVSINVSAIQVERGGLAESILRLIRDRGLQRGLLHLELTETTMFRNMERSVELLNSLVALGVHLAIDDFGTGHSSLGMVRRLPVSTIKLDREFVRGIAEHSADQALAKATIAMAHGLGKTVIAEGVETEEQVRVLLALGCDAAQGRYFGGPVPPDELRF
jgi:diguanylate cyclase (GGDEF)-like protein